jgi:hypothetical protein
MDAQLSIPVTRNLTRALKTYLASLLGLWAAAARVVSFRRFVLHAGYPLNSIMLPVDSRFWDFNVFAPRYAVWGHGDRFFTLPGFPFDYPPTAFLSELIFYRFSGQPVATYLGTVIFFASACTVAAAFAVARTNVGRFWAILANVTTGFLSYPLLFLLDRANIEGVVWMALSLGLLFFVNRRYTCSAVFLGIATAMKIFPGTLLLLLLAKRRFREFWLSIAAGGVVTFASLWIAGPTPLRAAQLTLQGMDHLRNQQFLRFEPLDVGFDHSLWSFIKQIAFRLHPSIDAMSAVLPRIYAIYGALVVVGFVLLYLFRLRRLPILNQILALSALSILLPYISFDYTLVHLFTPFAILLTVLASGKLRLTYPQMLALLLPFAIVFTPQSYLAVSVISFGGQVKAVAILALVVAAAWIPLPSSMFNEIQESEGA